MGTKKFEEKNIRKISKAGKISYYVTIPIDLLRQLKWKEGQKVIVRKYKGKNRLVIQDWKGNNEK